MLSQMRKVMRIMVLAAQNGLTFPLTLTPSLSHQACLPVGREEGKAKIKRYPPRRYRSPYFCPSRHWKEGQPFYRYALKRSCDPIHIL